MRRHARVAILAVFGLALILGMGINLVRPAQTAAATSNTVNFQARLESSAGAIVPDGNYNVEFKLYNASSSSGSSQGSCTGDANCLWTETRQNFSAHGVQVIDGYLTVNLGSVTGFPAINWDQQLWLTMNIGGTSVGASPTYDGEMTPRLPLTAIPYAFRAGQLALQTGANESTLGFAAQTAARSLLLPDENGTLCVQASANCGFTTGSGAAFIQGGNSFGAAGNLGTNDGNALNLRTNNATRLTVSTTGDLTFAGANTITSLANANLTLQANGTGTTTVDTSGAGTVSIAQSAINLNLASSATATTIKLGNVTGATSIVEKVGTGNYVLDGVGASTYTLGASTTTGTISIGGTGAQTGTISLGTGTGTQAINLATGAGVKTTTLGSTTGASATNIQAGTAGTTVSTGATTGSATAFQVQNPVGTALLNADTTNMLLSVGNVQSTGAITVAGPDGGSVYIGAVANSGVGAAMTFSGNEITDKTRATALQGDGRTIPDSSTGIWEGSTNLITNGGAEINTNTLSAMSSAVLTRDTTTAEFGNASVKVVTPGSIGAEGIGYNSATGLAAAPGTTYTGSIWVKGSGNIDVFTRVANTDATVTDGTHTTVPLTSTWQRIVPASVAVAAGKTGNQVTVFARTTTTEAITYWTDGAQVEQKAYATPYIDTSTVAVARTSARVQAPIADTSMNQGWYAARVRMGVASTANVNSYLGEIYIDTNNRLALHATGSTWALGQVSGGVSDSTASTTVAYSAGQIVTAVFAWTASNVSISINGGNFVTVSRASIPAGSLANFEIGSNVGSNQQDGDTLWSAAGTGTLTNADAASLFAAGNADPSLTSLNAIDSSDASTFAWGAENTAYSGINNNQTLQSGIILDDVNLYRTLSGSTSILNTDNLLQSAIGVQAPSFDTAAAGTLSIGTANSTTVNLGNATVASAINIGGTGANTIAIGNTQTGGSISLGAALTTGTINIGGTGLQTGTINVGVGTGAQALNFGTGGTGAKTVIVGSTASTGTTTVQGGTGGVNLGTGGIANTVQIGNITGAVAQTINIGNNATGSSSSTIVIGSTVAGSTTLQSAGGVIVSTLGAANTNTNLCRNASNQIATCNTTGTGTAFVQGGNSFGAQAVLGTNDANSLAFETNNNTKAILDTTGNLTFQQASTISTSTGNLTLQANGTSTATLDTSGAGIVTIAATATTLNLASTGGATAINIGNVTGAAGIVERVGTGNYSLDGVTNSTYTLGASTTTGTIAIGGTAQTGNLTLGSSSGTNSVLIGNGTGATTVSIGNANAAGTINLGNALTTGTINISTGVNTGTLSIGTGTGVQTINLATGGTGAKTVTLGSLASTGTTTVQGGTGGLNLGTGGIANTIQIGNITGAVVQGINIGTNSTASSTNNVTIGSTVAGTTIIQGSGISQTITGSGDTIKTTANSTTAFQIQDSNALSLLTADTTNRNLIVTTGSVLFSDFTTPTTPTSAFGTNGGGSISGASSTTYYYKVTALNASGESIPSAQSTGLATSSFTPLTNPVTAITGVAAAGSNLGIGNYLYKYTWVTPNGETQASGNESATITTTSLNQTINLTLPTCPTGASSIKIYRTAVGGASGSELYTGLNPACGTSSPFADTIADGSRNGAALPGSNTAITNTNSITLTWTAVGGATSYKIYRTTTSNTYGASSLIANPAASPYTDTSASPGAGTTPTYSTGIQVGIGTNAPTANLDVRGTVLFKNQIDTATAFQVQNAAGNQILTVDTAGTQVVLGKASTLTGKLVFNGSGGAGTLTLTGPTTPNAGNFTLSIPAITGNANICTDNSICTGYAPSTGGSYIAKNTNDTSSASFVGNLLGFTNTNAGAAGVLSLTNSGTNSALTVTTSGNPTAGQAVIFASNTNAAPTGNLIDLQSGSAPTSKFSVTAAGAVTAASTYNTNTFNGNTLTFGTAGTSTIQSNAGNLTLQAGGANTASLDSTGAGTATLGATNATTVTVGNNTAATLTTIQGGTNASNAIALTPGTAGAILIGAAAGTGNITLGSSTAAQSVLIGNGVNTGAQIVSIANGATAANSTVNILSGVGTAGAGTLLLGNNTRVTAIDIGNVAAAATRIINVGTGANIVGTDTINIGTGATTVAAGKTIHIGDTAPTGSGTNVITIGTTAGATSTTTIQGGTGTAAIALTPGTAGTIVIGAAAGTGNITLGSSTAAESVLIGNGVNTGAQIVSIANGATAANSTVNILSGVGTAGAGDIHIGNNTRVNVIDIGNIAAAAARTINVGTGSNTVGIDTLNIGTGATTVAGGKTINIGNGTPTGSGTNIVSIGSIAALANTTTIQGGNGAGAVSIQAATSGTISVGTANANTLSIGNTTAGTIINERVATSYSLDGVAASTYALGASTTTGTITIGGTAQSTGAITLGSSTAASSVLIANGSGAPTVSIANASVSGVTLNIAGAANTSANSINIANGASAAATTVNILSGVGTAGAGDIHIGNNTRVNVIDIGNIAAAAARTINVGTGSNTVGIDTLNIGTGATTVAGGKTINIGNGTPTGSGTNIVSIGSLANASATTIQGGTGNINLNANGSSSTGVVVKSVTANSTVALQVQNSTGNDAVLAVDTVNDLVKLGVTAGGVANALQFTGGTVPAVSAAGTGNIYYDVGSNTFKISANGGAYSNLLSAATDFIQGGNSFGAQAVLGTNDTNSLAFETNGTTRAVIDTSGNFQFQQASTINNLAAASGTQLTIKGGDANSGTNAGGNLLLQGGAGNSTGASGSVIIQSNGNNSATAFQVQNAAGSQNSDNLVNLSSVYNANNKVTNGSFEVDATGWAATANVAISQDATQSAPYGSSDLKIISSGPPVALNGAKYTVNMTNNTVYSMSFYAKTAAAFATMTEGFTSDGTTMVTTGCSLVGTPSTTTWLRFACTFTYTGTTNNGTSGIFIGQNDTTARTWYVDGVSLEQVATGSYYKEGTLNLNGLALGNTLIQPAANSNQALVVTSVAGVNGLTVDTNGSALTTSFATTISAALTVNSTGLFSATSTTEFGVRNSTTLAKLINADTSTITNIITNGGVENAVTGYAANGAHATTTQDATAGNAYEGLDTLKTVTTTSVTANEGSKYTTTTALFPINSSPGYTLSFYAKLPAGSAAFTTLVAGRAEDGSTNTLCTLNSTTVTTYWQRFSCHFTTSVSSGTPYIFFGQSDAGVAHTYFIDSVQLISAATPTLYREGLLQFNGIITSPTVLQNASDSTNAFQIQNAESSTTLLNVDTGGTQVAVNGQLAVSGGLSTVGLGVPAAPTITQGGTPATTSYTYAVSALNANGGETLASTGTATGTGAVTLTGTNFNKVAWTSVPGAASYNIYRTASSGTPSSTGLIGNVVATTTLNFNDTGIAGVGSTPTVDNSGQLNATGTALFQNAANSTAAFQVQNAAGNNYLQVDTSGANLYVGNTGIASTIQVGNTTGAVAQTINIGNNTTASSSTTVKIGSKIGTSPTTIQSGTSGVTVAGASSTTAFNVQNAAGSAAVLNIDNNLQVTTLRAGTDTGVLGAEMMTGSESFPATAGWTAISGTGTSATATHTNGGGVTALSPTPALSILNTTGYNVTYTISGTPAAGSTLVITMGGQTIASYTFDGTTDSNFTDTVAIFTSATTNLAFTPSTTFNGTVSGVSVKQITGNNNPALVVKNASGATSIEVRASTNTANTFIGIQSGLYNVSGNFNTALGDFSLQSDTSGSNNTAIGNNALQSNVSGSHNVAMGLNALQSNTSGSYNIAVGENSLGNNTVGANNTALGNAALESNTIGLLNTAVGNTALQSNTTGWRNTGIGNYSMINNTTGAQNSALGSSSLLDNTTGNQNDAPGDSVLASNTTGSDNSGLGYSADVLTGALQNATVIGANAQVGASNNIILGYSQANGINDTVGIGTSFAPDALTVSPQTYGTNGSVGSATTIEQDNGTHTCPSNSGTAIIGAGGTAFTSGMNGATIYYSDGTSDTVFYNSATSLTAAHSKCVAAGSTYNIVWGGLHVHASTGSTSVESVTNSTTAFSVNDNLDNQILAVDSVNQTVGIGPVASGTTAKLLVTTGAFDNLVLNQTSTNALLRLQNAGTDVATVTNTGATTFRNSTNSTTAFQIQSSLGTNEVLNADTTNTRVGIGTNAPDATLSVKTPSQNAVINLYGTSASTDYGSIQVGGTGDISNAGNRSLWLQPNNGSVGIGSPAITPVPEALLQVVGANASAAFPFNVLATDNTAFAQGVGGGIGFSGFIDNSGSDFAFGAIQGVKENGTSGNDAGALHFLTRPNGGNLTQVLGLSSTGAALFKNSTNSTTAFQIQNVAGTSVLNYDTTLAVLSTKPFGASYIGGADVSGTTNGGTGSNIVHQTYTSGRYEYVITSGNAATCSQAIGSAIGCELQVYDVSNPATPTYVGGASEVGSTNSGTSNIGMDSIYISGHYAYIGAGQGSSTCAQAAGSAAGCQFQIYDISNPSAPAYVGGANVSGATNANGGNNFVNAVYVSGRYAYIATGANATACSQTAGSAIGCEFQAYDVSNPATPTYLGGADVSGTTNGGTGSINIESIGVQGRYAYIGTGGNATACSQTAGSAIGCEFQAYDISNPSAPAYVGGADISGSTNSGTGNNFINSNSLAVQGRYAYVGTGGNATACSQTAGSAIGCEFQAYDVSNPSAPAYVGGADASGTTNGGTGNKTTQALTVSGRYAYVTTANNATACSQTAGSAIGCELQVYDISAPATPAYVGGADSSGSTNSGSGNGSLFSISVSGSYAYVGKTSDATACSQTPGSAIGCEMQSYNIGGIQANTVQADSLEGSSLQVDNNAAVSNQLSVGGSLSVGQSLEVQGDVGVNGSVLFQNTTDSTTAFQVQNVAGTNLLAVDTTTAAPIVNIGVTGSTALASTVNIANTTGAAIQTVNIGSNSNVANITTIKGGNGTGAIALTPQTTGTIVIGAAAGTGAITLGSSTGAQTVNIGTGAGAANNQTVNVGTTVSGGAGIKAINIGATSTTTNGLNTVTILAGNHSGSTVANGSRAGTDTNSTGIKVSLGDMTSTTALCVGGLASATAPTSGTGYELVDCSSAPIADYAEQYPVAAGVQVGDVVATGSQMVNTYDATTNGSVDWTKVKGQITQLVQSDQAYQSNSIGIVSDNNSDFSSTGYNIKPEDNPMSVALNGRVPVNVTTENGPIEPGDYLTTSATHPGYAMRATQAGYVIGQALAAYTSSDPGQVMTFVKNTYYPGPDMASMIQNGGDATLSNLTVNGNTSLANLDVAGDSTLSNLNVSGPATLTSLTVTGDANVGGQLTVAGNANIGGNLTVTGLTNVADLVISGHIITAGGQPTVQVQTPAGAQATATVTGTDTTGTISITTGSNPTAGALTDILFSKAYGAAPHIVLSPSNDKAAALRYFKGGVTTNDFIFNALDTPAPNTTYQYDYFVGQ